MDRGKFVFCQGWDGWGGCGGGGVSGCYSNRCYGDYNRGLYSGHFGLYIDSDLNCGRTDSCSTFGNPPLTPESDFVVKILECWAFATLYESDVLHSQKSVVMETEEPLPQQPLDLLLDSDEQHVDVE